MSLRNWASIISIAFLCAIPTVSRADTIYDVTGVFSDVAGSVLSGTYAINSSGVITAADLSLDGVNFDVVAAGASAPIPGVTTYSFAYVDTTSNPADYIELEILGTNTVCSAQITTCTFFGGPQLTNSFFNSEQLNLISGSATAVTPEPSSLWLLGTGLVGAFTLGRRKLFKA